MVGRAGLDDIERRTVTGYRWWSHEELAVASDPIYPPELAGLVRSLAGLGGTVVHECRGQQDASGQGQIARRHDGGDGART
jgi:hypothetical protein